MANDRGSANFVFGMGFGKATDESNTPSTVGDEWVSGNTFDALPPGSKWSNYRAYVTGTEYQYGFVGLGLYADVGEWNHAIGYGNTYFNIYGVGLISLYPPYYTASGVSNYVRDDTLHKMTIGSYNVPDNIDHDVMDSKKYLTPSATARYPMEGWQPVGQWDMDGGPTAA
jgi:hypothetical protein